MAGGQVRINSNGSWGTNRSLQVSSGGHVTLQAQANTTDSYTFDGWYVGSTKYSSDPVYQVQINDTITYVAKFKKLVVVTAHSSTSEGGNVRINGGTWGQLKTSSIYQGTQVTLEVQENSGYQFEGWYNTETGQKVSSSKTYQFSLNATGNTAVFYANFIN